MAENAICMKYGLLKAKEMHRGQIISSYIVYYALPELYLEYLAYYIYKRTFAMFRRFILPWRHSSMRKRARYK
jgi:hypothetical protein